MLNISILILSLRLLISDYSLIILGANEFTDLGLLHYEDAILPVYEFPLWT